MAPTFSDWTEATWWRVTRYSRTHCQIDPPGPAEPFDIPWIENGDAQDKRGSVYVMRGPSLMHFDLATQTYTALLDLPDPQERTAWRLWIDPQGKHLLAIHPQIGSYVISVPRGALLAKFPPTWTPHWTGGDSPCLVAHPLGELDADSPNAPSLRSLWIDAEGAREVPLPQVGRVFTSESGRMFQIGKQLLELDSDGQVLRTIAICP